MRDPGGRRAIVKRLVVRGAGLDPVAARLSAEALLEAADIHPPSLPPAAILAIRRLPDPLPGALSLDRVSLRPPRAWSDALAASLDAIVRRAARPSLGTVVAAAADAVLFSDRSDLLACLAVDFVRGEVAGRWWWSSLLPDASTARAAVAAWIAAPEHVPGALQQLTERREVAPFLQALASGELENLARSIADRWGVPVIPAVIAHQVARAAPGSASIAAAPREAMREPWDAWAPEARSAALDPAPRALLGIALALHRAPAVVRSLAFAGSVRRWIEATPGDAASRAQSPASAPSAEEGSTSREECAPRANDAPGDVRRATPDAARVVEGSDSPFMATRLDEGTPERTSSPSEPEPEVLTIPAGPRASELQFPEPAIPRSTQSAAPLSSPPGAHAPPLSTRGHDDTAAQSLPMSASASASAAASAAASARLPAPLDMALPSPPPLVSGQTPPVASPRLAPADEDRAARPSWTWSAPVTTRFGGVFFLVNLGLYLDLYGDFTTPLTPGIDLPIWDFVTLVARDLLGPGPILSDPVWPLLAQLAGRSPDDPPGARFDPPGDWRVPARWLKPFHDDGVFRWSSAMGRLRLRHPAGFVLVDVPLETDADAQDAREAHALREARRYGEDKTILLDQEGENENGRGGADNDASSPAVRRWLDLLMPYIRARLSRAMRAKDVGRCLCATPARAHVTTTHIDVVISLADLPVEVRLSGLDRDPGWVPAAGRYVAFHFVTS